MFELIGWMGIAFGFGVAPFQLRKILKTKRSGDLSLGTYICLCCALACYLAYSISIENVIFITAQSINLGVNGIILGLMLKGYVNGKT